MYILKSRSSQPMTLSAPYLPSHLSHTPLEWDIDIHWLYFLIFHSVHRSLQSDFLLPHHGHHSSLMPRSIMCCFFSQFSAFIFSSFSKSFKPWGLKCWLDLIFETCLLLLITASGFIWFFTVDGIHKSPWGSFSYKQIFIAFSLLTSTIGWCQYSIASF